MIFKNRYHAGEVLGEELKKLGYHHDYLLLGLARGGVPVAFAAARQLEAEFDVFIVRKLGVPGHEELAMGAIAPGQQVELNRRLIASLGISQEDIKRTIQRESVELGRRLALYRAQRPALHFRDRKVLLVDDGLATGASMKAACKAMDYYGVGSLHIAVPVGSEEACEQLLAYADRVICVEKPSPFYGVGQWYMNFTQTSDEEVIALLQDQKQDQKQDQTHKASDSAILEESQQQKGA